jgi:hypothetical protein
MSETHSAEKDAPRVPEVRIDPAADPIAMLRAMYRDALREVVLERRLCRDAQ